MIPMRADLRNWRFAERPILIKTLSESHREFLTRAGAFIRKVEQRSMKKGSISKRSGRPLRSKAGKPPKYWGVGEIRRSIAFHVMADGRSVVIEPNRWRGSKTVDILETGGRTTIYDSERGVDVPVTIENREYATPARNAFDKKKEQVWLESFRVKRRGRV